MRIAKEFQEATINAIMEHFKEHDRVLCADEAGLGKTIVAAEVIDRLAFEKIKENNKNGEYKQIISVWWKGLFQKNNPRVKKGGYGGADAKRFNSFVGFIKKLNGSVPDEIKTPKKKANGNNDYDKWRKDMKELGDTLIEKACESPDGIRNYLIAAAKLYKSCSTDQNDTKNMNGEKGWGLVDNAPLPEPFRVLYICNNLAVADQNARKLVTLPQRSYVSADDRPDRLSVLWYYIENYPTPYVEIYPITSGVSKVETKGNKNERRILEVAEEEDISSETRIENEEKSLKALKPDLVIFDEFQKFIDIVNLVDMEKKAFESYLESIKPEADDEDGEKAKKRKESLERCYKICSRIRELKPNLLFLSATPFTDGTKNELKDLPMEKLVKFMRGNKDDYKKACEANDIAKIQSILYNDCGIFRSERIRLMRKSTHSYTLVKCSDSGIFARALTIKNNTGKIAGSIARNVPDPNIAQKVYGNDKYTLNKQYEMLPELAKYQRLRGIIMAADSDDVGQEFDLIAPEAMEIKKLLWIPPVSPSHQLSGVFAKYRNYSKALVFTNKKIMPEGICDKLCEEISKNKWTPPKELKQSLAEYLGNIKGIAAETLAQTIVKYFKAAGGNVFDKSTTIDDVIDYCESGCLKDVIAEYIEECEKEQNKGTTEPISIFNKGGDIDDYLKFAYCLDETELEKCGVTTINARMMFNSPFYPFVIVSTSIGAEGLDFHKYCNRLVHYTMPKNPIELEQKNGRIDRYHSLAQRRWWATPGRLHTAGESLEQMKKLSGGLIPDWDAGEGGLHYYFLYTENTSELSDINSLLNDRKSYRRQLGLSETSADEAPDLCPYTQSCRLKADSI